MALTWAPDKASNLQGWFDSSSTLEGWFDNELTAGGGAPPVTPTLFLRRMMGFGLSILLTITLGLWL